VEHRLEVDWDYLLFIGLPIKHKEVVEHQQAKIRP